MQDALANLMMNRTSFVIAHRLSTIRRADAIVVMERGRVVEVGRHDELVTRPHGVYARLHSMQLLEGRRRSRRQRRRWSSRSGPGERGGGRARGRPMIKSMTGFSSITHEDEQGVIGVTIRAVNHRYLDLQLRAPSSMSEREPALRAAVQRHVARGRVELSVSLQPRQQAALQVELNAAFLGRAAGRACAGARAGA